MAAQRVDEGAAAHEPVLVDVAAEMHELVDQVHAAGRRHEQPADVRREHRPEDRRRRDRHQDEHDQRVRREHGDAPVLRVAEAHLLVGEELMVIERVPLVDGAQALDVDGPVHDVFVHGPFEQIGEQEGRRHRQPFPPGHVMDVLDVDVERGGAHRVDDGNVEVAVVPADDARAIFVAEFDLPLANHPRVSPQRPL